VLALGACGGGDDPGDGVDCGFPSQSDRFMPFAPGFSWEYRVTDLGSGVQTTKSQRVGNATVSDDDLPGLELLEQTTEKFSGSTVSLLTLEGEALVRYKQEDFDETAAFERATLYSPAKIRLDEGRATTGTTFDESYTSTITNAAMETTAVDITEAWEVIGEDIPCSAPFGELTCLQVRRVRAAGGTANKDFFYARGVGKVREEGLNQLEELVSCGP
jgi:hypothetical protein